MQYTSTRDKSLHMTAAQAIAQGLSPEGGLLVPENFPHLSAEDLESLKRVSYPERAARVMGLFLDDFSEEELKDFSDQAYSRFDTPTVTPLRILNGDTFCLELWHGPTCAFKDMALQMLPLLLTASLLKNGEERKAFVLAATSGDTGKAALEGFRDVDRTKILAFYPRNGVSKIQKLQMVTQEGNNVGVCAVDGNFDDAQTGVKRLFTDPEIAARLDEEGFFLTSANSINWGRVLPQIVYYVSAYCQLRKAGAMPPDGHMNVCVPTGNFGNILAAYYAKKIGVPIGKLICASNSNNVLTDFIKTGTYDRNRTFYQTISPSMDILVSSNLERLLFDLSGGDDALVAGYMDQLARDGKYTVTDEIAARIQDQFEAGFCDENMTRLTINSMWWDVNYLIDPHTAVAFQVLGRYRDRTGDDSPAVVVSTASPYKFCGSVLEALGASGVANGGAELIGKLQDLTKVPAPAPLADLADREVRFTGCVEPDEMAGPVLEMLS